MPLKVSQIPNWPIFNDVSSGHWAYSNIKWAKENNIVNGYENGKFAPNATFTEAQFAAVFSRYLNNIQEEHATGHWAQGNYNALKEYNIPLLGYTNDLIKNQPVIRGTVARVFAASQGVESDLETAILWMYDQGLTTGKHATGNKIKDYDQDGYLTRAQAVTFLKSLQDKGMLTIKR